LDKAEPDRRNLQIELELCGGIRNPSSAGFYKFIRRLVEVEEGQMIERRQMNNWRSGSFFKVKRYRERSRWQIFDIRISHSGARQ
jgi:hypothetical protein